jgi:predicted Rdx family selenoprotein
LAAELRSTFPNADVRLKPSGGGRFEVTRDGQPIFEKSKLGRHAKTGEIVSLLTQQADPKTR